MPTYEWTGLGLASGTVLDNTNVNATGNGTGTLIYQALSAGATRTTVQEVNGNGVTITGPATSLARLDTSAIAGGAQCMSIRFRYQAPAAPTTDHNFLVVGRNANATPASTSHVVHTLTNIIEFRNAGNTVVAGGQTPALTAGQYYDIDMAVLVSATAPSTTNGRIIGRVVAVNNANWVSTGVNEFYVDTGYTINVTADQTNLFRTGKAATAGAVGTFRFLNLRWRDLTTPSTSTTKSSAITNFATSAAGAPTISTTGTGTYYVMYGVGTATAGGALTHTIVQNSGNPQTPVSLQTGVWRVALDPDGPLSYTITVTEAGGGETTTTHTVPQGGVGGGVSGQFRRRQQAGGVLI